jgi:CO/xanthine dehydrogenase FAD-binding subunit
VSAYAAPASLAEALDLAARPGARLVAGGTDLMVGLRSARLRGEPAPPLLVDLSRAPELARVEPGGGRPFLGAGVTFRRLEADPGVAAAWPVLAQAAATVGSVQIRQRATIGGNAANASPAADGVAALAALGAAALLVSVRGERELPLEELVTGPYQTCLAPGEIIAGFYLDTPPAAGQLFAKVGRRRAVTVSRLNLALCLRPGLDGCRVVLGSCYPTPRRLEKVEQALAAGSPGPELWAECGRLAAEDFVEVCGWRSSASYKVPAIQRLTARALERAWTRLEAAP